MREDDSDLSTYLALMAVFVPMSLVAIGGGPSVFAPIQREAVDVHEWITAREFVEIFAVARVAPGPGSMLATLIGWKVAGWTGALVATAALFIPSSIMCLGIAKGVRYLHANDIIHRDNKSANMLLCQRIALLASWATWVLR